MSTATKSAFLAHVERTHGHQLRRYLATRLRNASSDVADLTQEVYLRLLRIDNHETIRNPQAYLYTIASHVLHQHALRNAAAAQTVELLDLATELQNMTDLDPATQLETEQRFEQLASALNELSPRAYATLVLHRCDGVPLQQIAEKFGVSYSMTKKYLAKALLYCQQQLQEAE